ncbi:MAG: hypothetical protein C5B51_19960 [Terriglobia bacterium]|nr:MAG: hypothetical protein C5B51_19960 [Terriglobia bacterium]
MRLKHALLLLAACVPLFSQSKPAVSAVRIAAAQDYLLCARTIQLTGIALDQYGGQIAGFAPQWQSMNPALATVDQNGIVQGLLPGVVTIQASDPSSGAVDRLSVRVQPLRIEITPRQPQLRVGESLQLAGAALDADGKPIAGVKLIWTSGISAVASVASDGTVSALRPGAITISAAIDSGGGALDFSSDIQVNVFRKPDFKLSPLVSSDDPGGTATLTAARMISAAGDAYVATIADLSTGGQGLILTANGAPALLATSGQALPGVNKVINRFTGVSVNTAGDVAATVQFPAEWCDTALVLFHQNQSPLLLDNACNITITDRALSNTGDVVYSVGQNGSRAYVRRADGTRIQVLQNGDKISGSLTVGSVGRAALTSTGAAILEVYPVGAAQQFWRWNGSSFEKLAALNDFLINGRITQMDFPVESGTGEIYSRIFQSDGPGRVMHYTGGTWTQVAQQNTKLGNTQIWWIHQVSPAGRDGSMAIMADSSIGTSIFRLTTGDPELLAGVSFWSNVNQLAGAGSGLFLAGSLSGTPAVYKLGSGSTPAALLSSGWRIPSTMTASLLWDSVPDRGSATNPLLRMPGNALARAGQSSPIVAPGSSAGGVTVFSTGNVVTSPDGKNAAFTAITNAGPAIFAVRDGRVDLIADTNANALTGDGQKVTWISDVYAMNTRGQLLVMANTGSYGSLWRFDPGSTQLQRIASMQQPSPAGPAFNWVNQTALDASGNAAFTAALADGSQALFLWNGGQLQKLLRTGESGPQGAPISGLANMVQFSGKRLIARFQYRTGGDFIQAFDGDHWTSLVSAGDTLSTGLSIDNFVGGYGFANDAGDTAYEARTLGYPSLLVRSRDGRDLVVASATDPLPDGSWPVFFYGFNITADGSVLFVAETLKDGKSRMTLYSGTR